MKKIICLFLILVSASCGKSSPRMFHKSYRVGVDPSFFPTELGQQQVNVYAFISDLIRAIETHEGVQIEIVPLSWDNLIDEMTLGKVNGVISSAPPNLINMSKYTFSDPILCTGPVLVVPKTSSVCDLSQLGGKVVATRYGSDEIEIIANYPNTQFIFYDRVASALELVSLGNIQATLIPIILANRYVEDLFHNSLKIVSEPLTNEGLRLLIPLKGDQNLPAVFNRGTAHLYKNGEYQKILAKWALSQHKE